MLCNTVYPTKLYSGVLLNCNKHACPRRCHQLQDHSRMKCGANVESTCTKNHKSSRRCHELSGSSCRRCEQEAKASEKKRKRAWELDRTRQAKQEAYARELDQILEDIEHEKRMMKNLAEDQAQENVLAQKKLDLANMKRSRSIPEQPKPSNPSPAINVSNSGSASASTSKPNKSKDQAADPTGLASSNNSITPKNWDTSTARDEWNWQKTYEHADNHALDELMGMIGMLFVGSLFKLMVSIDFEIVQL